MSEAELRRLAGLARVLLSRLCPDRVEADRIDADLAAALALAPGAASWPLLEIFTQTHRDVLLRWFSEQTHTAERDRAIEDSRRLVVAAPTEVALNQPFAVYVRIGALLEAGEQAANIDLGVLPPEGVDLAIDVWSPGLVADDKTLPLHLPATGDSDVLRFGFRATTRGRHDIRVVAWRGGNCVGKLTVSIAVEEGTAVTEEREKASGLNVQLADPGAFTLLVQDVGGGRYRFLLRGAGSDPAGEIERLKGDPQKAIGELAAQLGDLAAGVGLDTPKQRADQLQQLRKRGISLWNRAVPPGIHDQFWAIRAQITSLTVASEWNHVPWELMYPRDMGQGDAYLIEQFPVLRQPIGDFQPRILAVTSAAYVLPPGSPADALTEIERIRRLLPRGGIDYGKVETYDDLDTLLTKSPPAVLHFACHNDFSDEAGSEIALADGQLFTVDSLAEAVADRTLHSSLVFINACRSAGEFAGWRNTSGWANEFVDAGASAFLGSLWAIRSSSAVEFADAFYDALVVDRLPLGEAALKARMATRSDDADPTWLAYTVHGHPASRVGGG